MTWPCCLSASEHLVLCLFLHLSPLLLPGGVRFSLLSEAPLCDVPRLVPPSVTCCCTDVLLTVFVNVWTASLTHTYCAAQDLDKGGQSDCASITIIMWHTGVGGTDLVIYSCILTLHIVNKRSSRPLVVGSLHSSTASAFSSLAPSFLFLQWPLKQTKLKVVQHLFT